MVSRVCHRIGVRGCALALQLTCLLGCAQLSAQPSTAQEPPASETPVDSPATAQEAQPPAQPSARFDRLVEPPDGRWLVDEKGYEYFVAQVPRIERTYKWLNEERTMVQLVHGVRFMVDHYDDEFLYLRTYKFVPAERRLPPRGPTPEQLAAIADNYRQEAEVRDRLRFVPYDRGLPKRGQWRQGFDVVDMNGDGHLDILHGPPRKGSRQRPVIFLGDGAGNWRPWTEARFPSVPFDYGDVAAADFNGDGHMDFVLAIHLRGLMVLVGDGKGSFELWNDGVDLQYPGQGGTAAGFSSRAVEALDLNADGRMDFVALGEGPKAPGRAIGGTVPPSRGVIAYLNQGDGTWVKELGSGAAVEGGEIPNQAFGDSIAVGDFNGDGRADFVTSSLSRGWPFLVALSEPDGSWRLSELTGLPPGFFRSVASADFDRNGRSDVAVGHASWEGDRWRSGVDLYYSQPDGGWKRRVALMEESKRGIWALATGDTNGDGAVDLAAITRDGELLVAIGDGEGFVTQELSPELGQPVEGCRGYALRMADVDGDGRDEILAAFSGEGSVRMGRNVKGCPGDGRLEVWRSQPAVGGGAGAR